MKHFFTLITICALSFTNAQIFSENFSGGVPGALIEDTVNGNLSWTDCGGNTGGITCDAAATFFHSSASAYNTALDTPVLDLSSGVYKVSFTIAKRKKDDKINWFFLEISNDGGNTWNTIAEFLDEIYTPTSYTYVLTPYNPSSQSVVRFRGTNKGGFALMLDNVSIDQVTGDDASIQAVDVPNILVAGDVEIKGTLANLGINPITSFDLNWQVDGGATNTQNYTGQSIASGQTFNFTHSTLWNATGGGHNLRVWVSNTNVTDMDSGNDEFVKDVMVATGVSLKVPLFEKYSSSTCPPCYGYNTNTYNPFQDNYGHDKTTSISYQVWWPGAGDPYAGTSGSPVRQEVQARVNYYSVNAAPTVVYNGAVLGMPSGAQLVDIVDQSYLDDRLSFFDIEADHTINGNTIDVTVNIHPYISANYNVQVSVMEKLTTGNVANNGETEFHHVFMKGLPTAAGTDVEFVQDEVETMTFSQDMSTTFVEEMEDLAVVVFIQDPITKQIIQSRYTDASGIVLGTNELTAADISLVPNPTTGLVKIISDKTVDVRIFDLTGKNVFNQSKVENNTTLNLTSLSKGVYVVAMIDGKGVETLKKLIIK